MCDAATTVTQERVPSVAGELCVWQRKALTRRPLGTCANTPPLRQQCCAPTQALLQLDGALQLGCLRLQNPLLDHLPAALRQQHQVLPVLRR